MPSALLLFAGPIVFLSSGDPTPIGDAAAARPLDWRIEAVLNRWQRAAQCLEPVGRDDQRRLFSTYKSLHTAHELAVAVEIRGPVAADELRRRFRWTDIEETGGRIRLTAAPRDRIEQLFFRGFEVMLDAETCLPTSVRFTTRAGRPTRSLALETRPRAGTIRLVSGSRVDEQTKRGRSAVADDPRDPLDTASVERVFSDWTRASAQRGRLSVKVRRTAYDTVFKIEQRSEGALHYEAQHELRFEIDSLAIAADAQSLRRDRDGKPFEPADPLPLVVAGRTDELRRLFEWRLLKETDGQVWLAGVARTATGKAGLRDVTIILDTGTWLPVATRTVEASGDHEVVHTFADWQPAGI